MKEQLWGLGAAGGALRYTTLDTSSNSSTTFWVNVTPATYQAPPLPEPDEITWLKQRIAEIEWRR